MKILKTFIAIILITTFYLSGNYIYAASNTHTADMEKDTDDYFQSDTDNGVPYGNTARSAEAWIYMETVPVNNNFYSMLDYGTRATSQDWTWNVGDDNPCKQIIGIYGESSAFSNTIVPVGAWHHIAHTYDGTTVTFYYDGQPDGTDTFTATPNTTDNNNGIWVGQLMLDDYYNFDGYIAYVRVWDDVRTDSEIDENYDCYMAGTEDNLVGHWRFNNNGTDGAGSNDMDAYNSATFQSGNLPTLTGACGAAPPAEAPPNIQPMISEI